MTIRKGTITNEIMKKIIIGGCISCAGYDIKILTESTKKNDRYLSVQSNKSSIDINRLNSTVDNNLSKQQQQQQQQQQQKQHQLNSNVDSKPLERSKHVLPPASTCQSAISPSSYIRNVGQSSNYPVLHESHSNNRSLKGSDNNESSSNSNDNNSNLFFDRTSKTDSKIGTEISRGSSNYTSYPTMDPVVLGVMREHQKEAATFLLAKLMGRDTLNKEKATLESQTIGNDGNEAEKYNNIYDIEGNEVSVTGAILADDMGTGKVFMISLVYINEHTQY
jgi:hypothetical protein